jgi:hypothetical protein
VPFDRTCPFCGGAAPGARCSACGRDPTANRRICRACGKQTPLAERACCHCSAQAQSELSWKIPLIVGLFVTAFALSVVLALVR